MKRDNSKSPYPKSFHRLIFKVRRRIETTFSQLTEQLNINKVLAKSLILAHNLSYFINTLLGKDTNIGNIKELVFG